MRGKSVRNSPAMPRPEEEEGEEEEEAKAATGV